MEILAFILGLIASGFIVSLSFARGQRMISLLTAGMSTVLIGQYLALSQPVAAVLSGMSLLYALLIYSTVGRTDSFSRRANGTPVRIGLLAAYTVVFAVLNGGIGWNTQLLAYIGSMLMVAVLMVRGAWATKLILLAAGAAWTAFQFQTGAYGNLLGQVFYFAGLGWSSWKLWRSRESRTALAGERALAPA